MAILATRAASRLLIEASLERQAATSQLLASRKGYAISYDTLVEPK